MAIFLLKSCSNLSFWSLNFPTLFNEGFPCSWWLPDNDVTDGAIQPSIACEWWVYYPYYLLKKGKYGNGRTCWLPLLMFYNLGHAKLALGQLKLAAIFAWAVREPSRRRVICWRYFSWSSRHLSTTWHPLLLHSAQVLKGGIIMYTVHKWQKYCISTKGANIILHRCWKGQS